MRRPVDLDNDIYERMVEHGASDDAAIGQMLDEAVRALLDEEDEDKKLIDERRDEPVEDFNGFVEKMKQRGRL